MNSTFGPYVPEGYHPPFAVVTPTDHSAWILIATALGLACSLTFCAIRVFVRISVSLNFGMDDYSLFLGTFLALIQSSLLFEACAKGLGKSVHLVQMPHQIEVQKLYYASNLLLIMSLCASKLSVVFFFLRLSPLRRHKVMFGTALILVIGWAIGSLFTLALQCDISQPWILIDQNCPNMHLRWKLISVFDMVFEITVVGMAVFLVWNLQSSLSSKAIVVSVFSFRLLMIVAFAFQIKAFDQNGWTTDPLLSEAPFIAWSQSEMNYSLISATIPSFQSFLKNLNTQFGGIGPNEKSTYTFNNSVTESRMRGGSAPTFEMGRMRSVGRESTILEVDEYHDTGIASMPRTAQASSVDLLESRPSVGTSRDRNGDTENEGMASLDSDESRRMIIRKDVEWNVAPERP